MKSFASGLIAQLQQDDRQKVKDAVKSLEDFFELLEIDNANRVE